MPQDEALVKQWALALRLIADMAEFTESSCLEVGRRIQCSEDMLVKMWKKHSGTAESFYKDNETYLYDLVDFNAHVAYFHYKLGPLTALRDCTVLDIGCGLGTLVFMLADQENMAMGYEINQKLVDFCRFRKAKYGLGGDFVTELPDIGNFDVITAIDTLEHIEHLGDFLAPLGEKMRVGTRLYHYDSFNGQRNHPMHFDHSSNIDGYLENAGFDVLNPLVAVRR